MHEIFAAPDAHVLLHLRVAPGAGQSTDEQECRGVQNSLRGLISIR